MKSAKSYAEKLRDPRWQRLRLAVLESAKWSCAYCEDKSQELQIHHAAYRKGAEPWDYKADELVCLCRECHIMATKGAELMRQIALREGMMHSGAMISLARGDLVFFLKYMCMAIGGYAYGLEDRSFALFDSEMGSKVSPLKNFVKMAIESGSK